jgi:glutamine synthetase
MSEVRQVPVPETEVYIDIWKDAPALKFVLCRALTQQGDPWDCCPRQFLSETLDELYAATGLRIAAAMEHEFTLLDTGFDETTSFSLESMRRVAGFIEDLARALELAKVGVETIEPEAGRRQYEVSCGPAIGLAAIDRVIITREVIREVARRRGYYASFSPKPFAGKIGSGAHLHFSFVDDSGDNVTFDASDPSVISQTVGSFASGVMRHLSAIAPFFASSPVSYLRLEPGNWSCGYASFGIQNRETALRVCPPPKIVGDKASQSFNLEFRPLDGASNPYLALGALVRAGLEGIKCSLPSPVPLDKDPARLSDTERNALGVTPLPRSLEEALNCLEQDKVALSWMSATLKFAFFSVLRKECELAMALPSDEICHRYIRIF